MVYIGPDPTHDEPRIIHANPHEIPGGNPTHRLLRADVGDDMWRLLWAPCRKARAYYNYQYGSYQSSTALGADRLVFSPVKSTASAAKSRGWLARAVRTEMLVYHQYCLREKGDP